MELALTSLIPSVVELTSFWQQNFPDIGWYPYWYAGVPYKFLIGPVVPLILTGVYKLFPIPLETLYVCLLGSTWIFGSLGVYAFVKQFGIGTKKASAAAVVFLLFPVALFLLKWGSGLSHLSTALLPWSWYVYIRSLRAWRIRHVVMLLFFFTTVLWLSVGSLLSLLIGIVILNFQQRTARRVESFAKAALLVGSSLAIATVWYTPRFWLVLLTNPSFAGKPLASVIGLLIQIVQALIPLIIGLWVVHKRSVQSEPEGYRSNSKLSQFGIVFGASFFFMTSIRFLSDIDFIADWSAYGLELQLALAFLTPMLHSRFSRYIKIHFVILLIILLFTIVDAWLIHTLFYNHSSGEYKEEITALLRDLPKDERVFLTGSPVFWLGTEKPLMQVRGNKDQAATHPAWADGAYQIREGESAEVLQDWLQILGVSHLLVADNDGREPYKDFKHHERFEGLVMRSESTGDIKVYEGSGSIARHADARLLSAIRPEAGNDSQTISNYTELLGNKLAASYTKPNFIEIMGEALQGEVISLAVTYDKNWRVRDGNARIRRDAFGNMALEPLDLSDTKWSLVYQGGWFSWVGIVASVVGLVALGRFEKLVSHFKKHTQSLVPEDVNEEETY